MGTQNFSFVPRSWLDEKHISLRWFTSGAKGPLMLIDLGRRVCMCLTTEIVVDQWSSRPFIKFHYRKICMENSMDNMHTNTVWKWRVSWPHYQWPHCKFGKRIIWPRVSIQWTQIQSLLIVLFIYYIYFPKKFLTTKHISFHIYMKYFYISLSLIVVPWSLRSWSSLFSGCIIWSFNLQWALRACIPRYSRTINHASRHCHVIHSGCTQREQELGTEVVVMRNHRLF